MKRSVKIASALVVLVLMLAQVIGVSAAVVTTYKPTFSTKIDSTGLTVTVDTINGASAYKIYVNNKAYDGKTAFVAMKDLNNYNYVYCMVTVDNRNFTSGTSTVDLSQPAIYYNVDQTDHFQKTVTASGRGGVGVETIRIDGYKNVNGGNQVNSYTTGLSPAVMEYMLKTTLVPRFGGKTSCDEIGLPVSATGGVVPCGATAIWEE